MIHTVVRSVLSRRKILDSRTCATLSMAFVVSSGFNFKSYHGIEMAQPVRRGLSAVHIFFLIQILRFSITKYIVTVLHI